jgi:PAS domain S-box-containing protein
MPGEATSAVVPLIGGGKMGQRVRDTDWSTTPLGAFADWPQSLRSSLSLVLNANGIAALYWGPEQWLLYNDAYGAALGDRHPGAFGRPMPEVLTDIAPVLGPQVEKVLATGRGFAIENRAIVMRRHGRDEDTVWTYSFSPIQGEGAGFVGVLLLATEMTQQKAAEREAQTNEARQRQLLQQMPGFVAVLRGPDHVFDYVNDAYVTLAGQREYVGRTVRDVFPDLAEQGFFELLDQVYATGEPFITQSILVQLAGEDGDHYVDLLYQPIRDDLGRVTGIFAGGYDITKRFHAEAAVRNAATALSELNETLEARVADRTRELELSEARAKVFYDASPDSLMLLRLNADGSSLIEDVNPALETLLGMPRSEIVGCSAEQVYAPGTAARVLDSTRQCLETGQSVTYTVQRSYQDKILVWIEAEVTCISRSADGSGLVLYTGHDVTQARQLEAQLHQSQKMEAVGQLTGGLAHDFNNLLTGVSGSLELLQMRIAQGRTQEVDRYVNAAQGAARRAAALTHRLLAFSRRQTLDPKPTDVNRLVAGMEELIRRTVGPEITVEAPIGAVGLWPTLVDPSQLENALLNLCLNARDAMPDGGKITIETGNRWMDERMARERDLPAGQYVSLCVSDTGTGMPPEVTARAFEPFFTTKPIGQGTGLGLSMIYGFAQQSGGQVRIYSEVGQGSTVCIYLPRHLGEAEVAELLPDRADLPMAEAGQTVLIVDDEPTVRMLVSEVLKDLGYHAVEAADGAAGLVVLQSNVRVDLLVTDVGLPGSMNGRQVADAARAMRPGLKVLFITGYAENAVLSHGHLDPGMQVLTKPFALEALARRIKDLTTEPKA